LLKIEKSFIPAAPVTCLEKSPLDSWVLPVKTNPFGSIGDVKLTGGEGVVVVGIAVVLILASVPNNCGVLPISLILNALVSSGGIYGVGAGVVRLGMINDPIHKPN
jgi:hypothetical protein